MTASDGGRSFEGNFAPVAIECEAAQLPIAGELPRGLDGTLFRIGPNPQFPPADPARHHWFTGDGMVHAFTLRGGRAGYRNRWVRTAKWRAEHAAGHSLGSGFDPREAFAEDGVANTNIVWHAGRLLALEELHLPIALDPASLATRGPDDFGGALAGPFTAHPHRDPETGELVFFGYGADGPLGRAISYGTIAADGMVTRRERFDAPYASMVHDCAVTRRHVLFPILPLAGSRARAERGQIPYAWEPALGAHIGVLRRDAGVASLQWFRGAACYVFHVLNAWDDGARIVADVMQFAEPPLFPRADGTQADPAAHQARLMRWTLDPTRGSDAFTSEPLDDLTGEFPRHDERRAGLAYRFGGHAARSRADGMMDSLAWHDFSRGTRALFTLPPGDAISEPVFVPRDATAPEGDGWLLAVAWRGAERSSDLLVLDASAGIERGPVATVELPHRVPFGFHGNWVGEPQPLSA